MDKIEGKKPVVPKQTEVERRNEYTQKVLQAMHGLSVKEAMTIVINVAGQLCAAISQGKPSAIKTASNAIAENIRTVAINKILYDDELRRKETPEQAAKRNKLI